MPRKDPEARRVYNAAYNAANREKIAVRRVKYHAAYYIANREKIAVRRVKYAASNKEKIAAYHATLYGAMTPEQRKQKLERARARRAAMTPEQRKRKLERTNKIKRDWRAAMTPEQRKRRDSRTPEQRKQRLERARARNAAMTPEQRAKVLAIQAAKYKRYKEFYENGGLVELLNARFASRMDHGPGESPDPSSEGGGT